MKYSPEIQDALYRELKRLEWYQDAEWTGKFCCACGREKEQGHAPNCSLDAALKAAEGKEEQEWEGLIIQCRAKLFKIKSFYKLFEVASAERHDLYEKTAELALMLCLAKAGDRSPALKRAIIEALFLLF